MEVVDDRGRALQKHLRGDTLHLDLENRFAIFVQTRGIMEPFMGSVAFAC